MNISVLVPTYRRTKDLERCLQSLQKQSRLADEVIVTARDTDEETIEFLSQHLDLCGRITYVVVYDPGVVAAMNAGVCAATGDIIALTDDDAAPRPDWLARIEAIFCSDINVGGVGGRDWLQQNALPAFNRARVVGKVQWFGRT